MHRNPWLDIPHADYDQHMLTIGQAQVINDLTRRLLLKYTPTRFGLLGCATGNGLEHVDVKVTEQVFAIDINPEYLRVLSDKYQAKLPGLEILELDINTAELPVISVDLWLLALILEYVDPAVVLPKIRSTLSPQGIVVLVIQQTTSAAFVTPTAFQSLRALRVLSKEWTLPALINILRNSGLNISELQTIILSSEKSFLVLTCTPD